MALHQTDPQVAELIALEARRQETTLELIASENHVSRAVLEAAGSVLTNKYAEGYPAARYYGGCEYYDKVESLAIDRARQMFGARFANVQPHSGANANLAAFMSLMQPGDNFLGINLSSGGHLTHGMKLNASAIFYRPDFYELDPQTETIDFNSVRAKAKELRPKVIVCGYSAYPRTIDFAQFRQIADEVGAKLMADVAHIAGLCVGGAHPSPFPHAHVVTTTTHKSLRGPRGGLVLATEEYAPSVDRGCPMVLGGPLSHVMAAKAVALAEARQPEFAGYAQDIAGNAKSLAEGFLQRGATLVTGGTDNHLVLLDVTSFGLTGRQAESALLDAGVVTNRNSVPGDPNGAWYTSGIRLGTPALTSRGFGHDEFDRVAELIVDVLSSTTPKQAKDGKPSKANYTLADGVADRTKAASAEMLDKYPLYPGLELS